MAEKTISNAYITGLYVDIETLNNNLAAYKNILVEITPTKDNMMSIPDTKKEQLTKVISDIRFLLIRSYIRVSSLKTIKSFDEFLAKNNAYYKKILGEPVPAFDELIVYVIELNQAFMNGVSNEFFNTVGDLYGNYNIAGLDGEHYPNDGTTNE